MTLKINMEYEVRVIDNKTGETVKKIKGKSKTFNLNFARLLGLMLFPRGDVVTLISATDTGGVGRTFAAPAVATSPVDYSPALERRLKLRIGLSAAAFDRTHYEMQSLIATFDYSTCTLTDTGTMVRVDISGSYLNPGASITVREIGFACVFADSGGALRTILLARDVIPDTVVGTNYTIAIAYAITIPF